MCLLTTLYRPRPVQDCRPKEFGKEKLQGKVLRDRGASLQFEASVPREYSESGDAVVGTGSCAVTDRVTARLGDGLEIPRRERCFVSRIYGYAGAGGGYFRRDGQPARESDIKRRQPMEAACRFD